MSMNSVNFSNFPENYRLFVVQTKRLTATVVNTDIPKSDWFHKEIASIFRWHKPDGTGSSRRPLSLMDLLKGGILPGGRRFEMFNPKALIEGLEQIKALYGPFSATLSSREWEERIRKVKKSQIDQIVSTIEKRFFEAPKLPAALQEFERIFALPERKKRWLVFRESFALQLKILWKLCFGKPDFQIPTPLWVNLADQKGAFSRR